MKSDFSIGVIGNGFVGQAIANAFALNMPVLVYDKNPKKSINLLREVIQDSKVIFLCLPTPMNMSENNKIDLSIIESCLQEISSLKINLREKVFVVKSTVVPGTTQSLKSKFKNMRIVFNPEFLTERTANLDFINATRIVIGGESKDLGVVEALFRERFPHKKIIKTDDKTSEFIKYMCNCFFATKVSFMNEMFQMSEILDLDWDKVLDGFVSDGRIGNSHLNVPGHDGHKGFGGKCFPKDINAIINFYLEKKLKPTVLSAVWKKNLEVRNSRDWEKIEGAISNNRKGEIK